MKTPRFWQSIHPASTALLPLAALYRLGAWADRRFTRPQRAPVPVIAIGNATAGGAGKTPTALALVPMLQALGHAPHILTRGYKGAALSAHRVTASDALCQVGDEALLLRHAAPVWVGRDRFAAANAAAQAGATILVCDDALQHHALHKDRSLLVIDGPYGIGNGRLLPAGPLREPFADAVARAHAVILIGDDAQRLTPHLSLPVFRANLQPAGDTSFLTAKRWLAFAGIGRPEKFYATLRALGADLAATRDFADHHAYSPADIASLLAEAQRLGATLITTGKDHVRIPAAQADTIQTLPVTLVFEDPPAFTAWLRTIVV